MTLPAVGPFVGDAPEDRHAERVVGDMLAFLDKLTTKARPRLFAAIGQPIGGTVMAQQRFLDKVQAVSSPAVIDIATAPVGNAAGSRSSCPYGSGTSLAARRCGGLRARGEGPGRVTRNHGPLWRLSRHALVRLVQRAQARRPDPVAPGHARYGGPGH